MSIFHKPVPKFLQINTLTGIGILLTLWYWEHPYLGIFQDARLYVGQALAYLKPEIYANDLFFLYGSQDKYTIFTFGYAKAIEYLGLNYAVFCLTFLGLGLWFGSCVFLIATLATDWIFWLALSLITLLPGGYGPRYILEYAENFLTPRLYTEALVLVSIGLALKQRWWIAGLLLAVAFSFHPLMTLPALLWIFFYQYRLSKLSLSFLILVGSLYLLFAGLQIEPFNRIFQIMDDEWYALVMQRSPLVTMSSWRTADWMLLVIDFSILISAWQVATGKIKRLLYSIIMATGMGLLLCALGDLVLHNVLIMQLQLWRVLWLTQWFTYFSIAWLVGKYWQTSIFCRLIILIFLSAWLMREHTGALISILGLAAWSWQVPKTLLLPVNRLYIIGIYLVVGQALFWFLINIDIDYQMIRDYFSGAGEWAYRLHKIGEGIVLIPLLWFIRHLVTQGSLERYSYLLFVGVGIGLCLSLLTWNRHTEFFPKDYKTIEEFAEFRRHIPKTAVVYWKGDGEDEPLLNCWLLLERACYISKTQSSGVVFNRSTAIEAKRRSNNVLPLSIQDSFSMNSDIPGEALTQPKKPNRIDLISVCQDSILDFVVLPEPVPNVESIAQQIVSKTKTRHYLYACQPLRSTS